MKETERIAAPVESESPSPEKTESFDRTRRGAAGKALIVWLGTGSLAAAIVAYLVFRAMGC